MNKSLLAPALAWLAITAAAALALAGPGPAQKAASGGMRGPHDASITRGLDCSACHTTQSWGLLDSGPSGKSGFDHGRTGFPLAGQHRHAACTDCHSGKMRVTRDCAGCHRDVHERRLGQACARCHNAGRWKDARAIERHRLTRLPLNGKHALLECTECHRRTTDRQWSSVPADCYACHAKDYRRPDIHPRHAGDPLDPSQPPLSRDCAGCHRPTGWSPAVITSATFALSQASTRASPVAPRQHDLRFPISFGKHRGASCSSCHVGLARPRLVRCDGCHAHSPQRLRRQHRKGVRPVGSCLGCHPGGAAR